MKAVSKFLALLALGYLLSGCPGILPGLRAAGLERTVALYHLGCVASGLAGFIFAFGNARMLSRFLSLTGTGLASLIYTTHKLSVAFPALIRLPLTLGSTYSTGQFYRCGIDAVPAAIFIALWLMRRSAVVRKRNSS